MATFTEIEDISFIDIKVQVKMKTKEGFLRWVGEGGGYFIRFHNSYEYYAIDDCGLLARFSSKEMIHNEQ